MTKSATAPAGRRLEQPEHPFDLGHPALDLEHQGQLDLLLDIEAELRGDADRAKLLALLDRLIDFTSLHFMSEQVLMREQAFPGLPDHEAEHDALMEQMRAFQERVAADSGMLTSGDLALLHDWVLRHICTKDAAFADYLAAPAADGAGAPDSGRPT